MIKKWNQKCPHCGFDEISPRARICPWCEMSLSEDNILPPSEDDVGEPVPWWRTVKGWLVVFGLLVLSVLAVVPFLAGALKPKPIELHADLQYKNRMFLLVNRGDYEWREVHLTLNTDPQGEEYVHQIDTLQPGEEYYVRSREFYNRHGERFDPERRQILNFGVRCRTPQGEGVWFGGLSGISDQ